MRDIESAEAAQASIAKAMERARRREDRAFATQVRTEGELLAREIAGLVRLNRFHDQNNAAFETPIRHLHDSLQRVIDLVGPAKIVVSEDLVYLGDVRLHMESWPELGQELISTFAKHESGGVVFHSASTLEGLKAFVRVIAATPPAEDRREALREGLDREGLTDVEVLAVAILGKASESDAKFFGVDDTDKFCSQAARVVDNIWQQLAEGRQPEPVPVRRMVSALVEAPPTMQMERWVDLTRRGGQEVPAHALRVSALATLTARALKLPDVEVVDLGVAATFHDVGWLPEGEEERVHSTYHGAAGARRLLQQRGFHEARVQRLLVCLQHHRKHEDPRGASLYSRIIHVADDFDLLTMDRPGGPLMAPPDALSRMMASAGEHYDPVILKAMVQRLGAFPPGTVMLLSDGRVAMVIDGVRGPESFTRPRVQVVREADGRAPETTLVLDLQHTPLAIKSYARPRGRPSDAPPPM